jgi:hypothetical protein
VVAHRRPCLRVARPPGVDDVAGVAVLGLPARVKDSLLDRRSALVGGLSRCNTHVTRRLGALHAPVVPRASLLADARRRALGLLHDRLLNERLRLAVQVLRLGRRGSRHGSQQCCSCDELLARSRGVFGLLTSKSALMRSHACLSSSRARSPRVEASPAMEARSSHTVRYSSAILASSSCAWASCVLMSAPLAGEVGAHLAPSPGWSGSRVEGDFSVASSCRVHAVRVVVDDHNEALMHGVVAPGAGVVGVVEPVIRGIEEPLEHHRFRHAGEVPHRIPG